MVNYSEWIEILFDLAKENGLSLDFETNQEIIAEGAAEWNQNGEDIRVMGRVEARNYAETKFNIEPS